MSCGNRIYTVLLVDDRQEAVIYTFSVLTLSPKTLL